MNKMSVKMMNVEDLIPYENNPRLNDDAVQSVANSIETFGFKVPIVVDKNHVVITGHTRLKAAKRLGLTSVPVIVADDLDDTAVKAFRLADNKVAELSKWDDILLAEELNELIILDFDMTPFEFEFFSQDDYGTDFELPDGDKKPFQQITFTFSDAQAEFIKHQLEIAKEDNDIETFGNENKNGNALYRVVREWAE